ncbi:hypothetical protein HPO96_36305 [Kribbella sandramycini]|uniref:AMIN-like domain-containing protein n=1 Tax=Kribbella sandramycini TaxID=60450 RepID=A0A7Y4L9J6_9ACTN|nr:hypothetical protein [Kribbella sandramycini]MBB6570154.1 hypothetical protein [Kribbella sandramycini]NOL45721.1 hypothetical protein [Kribbella sandramycini]
MNIRYRTPKTILAALAAAAVPAVALAAPGSSPAPQTTTHATACPTGWGSLPEANARMVQSPAVAVRSGRHACFDRLVVDIRGRAPGYDVRYVADVTQDGSGHVVPLRGGAKLQLVVRAPSDRHLKAPDVRGYDTFRQIAYAGSFEGQTTVGVGVRARLPFRVTTVAGPGANTRLVVDVAHRW